ncbi:hypothetical protein DL93DRAFT_249749 [Clavulina sp. PMI_390]|nr:hypothetical protein DL93DRAFT_249749 [Clavulina sp. PMI_390]
MCACAFLSSISFHARPANHRPNPHWLYRTCAFRLHRRRINASMCSSQQLGQRFTCPSTRLPLYLPITITRYPAFCYCLRPRPFEQSIMLPWQTWPRCRLRVILCSFSTRSIFLINGYRLMINRYTAPSSGNKRRGRIATKRERKAVKEKSSKACQRNGRDPLVPPYSGLDCSY